MLFTYFQLIWKLCILHQVVTNLLANQMLTYFFHELFFNFTVTQFQWITLYHRILFQMLKLFYQSSSHFHKYAISQNITGALQFRWKSQINYSRSQLNRLNVIIFVLKHTKIPKAIKLHCMRHEWLEETWFNETIIPVLT